jgi:hypothetical protein
MEKLCLTFKDKNKKMNIKVKIKDKTNIDFPIIIKDKKERLIYSKSLCGYSYERTYDEDGHEETYRNSNGNCKIRGEKVSKEKFESFINIPKYTMEELVSKIGNFKLINI